MGEQRESEEWESRDNRRNGRAERIGGMGEQRE